MKRLKLPPFSELELYDACIAEMVPESRTSFTVSREDMKFAASDFIARSATRTWCQLPRARHGHKEDIVVGALSKGSLMELYDEGVVKSKGLPRTIYDEILVAALGLCPYCADIGDAKTLDHYLPKAKFPGLSVHPYNLIPACRDCNTDAGAGFPMSEELQPINPYLDKDCFFLERWIHAEVIPCVPPVVTFFTSPPDHWLDIDKKRAKKHFKDCNLGTRFTKQVAGELGPLIGQRKKSLAVFSPAQFAEHLRVIVDDNSLLLNGWKRTLYLALSGSHWFCSVDFADLA
jgi:5-methylcytosine-specific restriction endonuclease McrA